MDSASRTGRIIGLLIILQMAVGITVNFGLEAPLFGTPGFLAGAGDHVQQLGLAVVLGLILEASWVGIAILAFPFLQPRSPALAVWLVVLAGVLIALAVAESSAVMSMVSLSEAYAAANATAREQIETVRIIVASARNWPHFMARIVDGVTILVFYAALYRSALIPRVLAGLGMIAAVSQISGIAVTLFGHDVIFPMLAPLGVSQLVLAVWLIAKGFRGQPAARQDRPLRTPALQPGVAA